MNSIVNNHGEKDLKFLSNFIEVRYYIFSKHTHTHTYNLHRKTIILFGLRYTEFPLAQIHLSSFLSCFSLRRVTTISSSLYDASSSKQMTFIVAGADYFGRSKVTKKIRYGVTQRENVVLLLSKKKVLFLATFLRQKAASRIVEY